MLEMFRNIEQIDQNNEENEEEELPEVEQRPNEDNQLRQRQHSWNITKNNFSCSMYSYPLYFVPIKVSVATFNKITDY